MSFNPTVNRYVQLVETVPHALASAGTSEPSEQMLAAYRLRREQFRDLFVEVGSGSGEHLLARAERNPEDLYVGFELRYKRAFRTVEKAENRGLKNIFVFRADAHLIPSILQAESLAGLYVNFPDPWDRKRWKKHRIMNPTFLDQSFSLLKPGGTLSYKTDHSEYFKESLQLLKEQFLSTGLATVVHHSENLYQSSYLADNVPSEFEMLFKSKKIPVFYVLIQKVGIPSAVAV